MLPCTAAGEAAILGPNMIALVLFGFLLSCLLFGRTFAAPHFRREYVMGGLSGAFIAALFSPVLLPIFRLNFRLALSFVKGIGLTNVSSFVRPFEGEIVVATLMVSGISVAVFFVWLGNRMNQNSGSLSDPGQAEPK
jgi:hypothetical protein